MTNQEYKSRKRIVTVMACFMSLGGIWFSVDMWKLILNDGRWFVYVTNGPFCVIFFLLSVGLPFGKRRDFEDEYGKR
jgi:hypothetical protein